MISDRTQRRFRDRVTIALESHVARLQASVATIEHHERPEYLDRLAVLRDQVFVLDHMYMSLFSTCGWILRLGVTVALLVSIHPALALLAVFALPTVLTSTWRPGVERAAEERGASANRLARHLFDVATTAPPGKEVRVTAHRGRLDARAPRGVGALVRAGRRGAMGQRRVARARVGGFRRRLRGRGGVRVVGASRASAGDVLLVLAAGSRLSAYIGATVGEIGFLRGIWLDGSRRLAWLEDYAASLVAARRRTGARATAGRHSLRARVVRLSGHRTRCVLEDVDRTLEPGSVVAIVGENGAGKTTLVKLSVPAVPADERAHPGRRRRSGAHARRRVAVAPGRRVPGFLPVRVPGAPHRGRRRRAALSTTCPRSARRSSAPGRTTWSSSSPRASRRSSGQPGRRGVEISFGQWQKLALARGFMRDGPLLLVLDEPTAALDAETEHALFERYAAAARGGPQVRPTAASRSWCRTASAPCGWPTSSSCSTARAWSSRARTKS